MSVRTLWQHLLATAVVCVASASGIASAVEPALAPVQQQQFTERPIPRFRVDAAWPQMPAELTIGQVPGLALDAGDNIWLLHRPNSLRFSDTGLAQEPPIARCCRPAPHVMQFSSDGRLLRSWGGEALAPRIDGVTQWPATVHGLYIDDSGNLWLGGNGDGDHVVLNFTPDGEYLGAIGRRNATGGNRDRDTLGGPADILRLDDGEVLVADGYINKRVIGFSAEGQFTRYFGAYASSPDDAAREGTFDQSQASSDADGGADPASRSFGDIVHCIVQGPDDRLYVCDRRNNRLQVFEFDATGAIRFLRDIVIAPDTGGTRTVSDVAFSPDGAFMYVSDMMNGQVWILDSRSYESLGALGRIGRYAGQFIWRHSIVVDSEGNLYTSEVGTGRRVQKFVYTGTR